MVMNDLPSQEDKGPYIGFRLIFMRFGSANSSHRLSVHVHANRPSMSRYGAFVCSCGVIVVIVSCGCSRCVPRIGRKDGRAEVSVDENGSAFFIVTVDFPIASSFIMFGRQGVRGNRDEGKVAAILLYGIFALLSMPFCLIRVGPIMDAVSFVELVIIKVRTVRRYLCLILLLQAVGEGRAVAASRGVFETFYPRVMKELRRRVVSFVTHRMFYVVISRRRRGERLNFVRGVRCAFPSVRDEIVNRRVPARCDGIQVFNYRSDASDDYHFNALYEAQRPIRVYGLYCCGPTVLGGRLLLHGDHCQRATRRCGWGGGCFLRGFLELVCFCFVCYRLALRPFVGVSFQTRTAARWFRTSGYDFHFNG